MSFARRRRCLTTTHPSRRPFSWTELVDSQYFLAANAYRKIGGDDPVDLGGPFTGPAGPILTAALERREALAIRAASAAASSVRGLSCVNPIEMDLHDQGLVFGTDEYYDRIAWWADPDTGDGQRTFAPQYLYAYMPCTMSLDDLLLNRHAGTVRDGKLCLGRWAQMRGMTVGVQIATAVKVPTELPGSWTAFVRGYANYTGLNLWERANPWMAVPGH